MSSSEARAVDERQPWELSLAEFVKTIAELKRLNAEISSLENSLYKAKQAAERRAMEILNSPMPENSLFSWEKWMHLQVDGVPTLV